jgi:hypothetical protein
MATDTSNLRRATLASLSAGILVSMLTLGVVSVSSGAAEVAPVITHAPRVAVPHGVHQTWAASNWSGYAETGHYTGVSGTWTVPSVSASSSAAYSSAWIGVDGFNNSSLIQTGTEEDYYNGGAHYNVWWEILPAAETALPSNYAVSPGDRMSASIYETSATTGSVRGFFHRSTGQHVWVITISDTSKGWTFTTNQGYNGPGTSAEWIMEAPQVGGRIATLAPYAFNPSTGVGDFDNAGTLSTTVSSGSPAYTPAGLNYSNDSGVMIQNGAQVSTPGYPGNNATAYNAAYGSSMPATTPTS